MDILLISFNAVLPSFLMMLAGFTARCTGVIEGQGVPKFNKAAFTVFLPATLFYSIYSSDFSNAVRPRLLAFTAAAVLIVFLLSVLYAVLFVRDKSRRGVVIQGLYRSNFVIMGLPIASALVDEADIAPVAVLIAVVVPMFNFLAVVCLEIFGGHRIKPAELVLNIVKNPLIIGSLLGLAFAAAGIKLPKGVESAVKSFAAVGSPLMLFLLGAFFRFESLRGHLGILARICVGRLIVIPALVLSAAYFMGFRGIEFAALMGAFASATAVSSFTMTQQMGGDSELAGNIVIATSVLCSFTMYMWSVIFKALGAV